MSNTKEPKQKKAKKPQRIKVPAGFYGGHRDLAEMISVDYALLLGRTQYTVSDTLMDMDTLTKHLEEMHPETLALFIQSDWGKGFLMGMFHQAAVSEEIINEIGDK